MKGRHASTIPKSSYSWNRPPWQGNTTTGFPAWPYTFSSMSCPRQRLHQRWYSTFIGGPLPAASRGLVDVADDGEELLHVLRADEIAVVADRLAEDGVHLLVVGDEAPEGPQDLLVGVGVPLAPFPPDVAAMVRTGPGGGELVAGDHPRPLAIDVEVVGEVEHVGGQAPRRPHVHLEGGDPAVPVVAEELEVEEPLAHVER